MGVPVAASWYPVRPLNRRAPALEASGITLEMLVAAERVITRAESVKVISVQPQLSRSAAACRRVVGGTRITAPARIKRRIGTTDLAFITAT